MAFSYVPADAPAIWMRFTPAEDLTAGAVPTETVTETTCVETEATEPADEVSTGAEKTNEIAAGPHIRPVERRSQLAECEYHRASVPVGKEPVAPIVCGSNIGQTSDTFFNLTTTTGCGRVAVVVETRKSTDQLGSWADCRSAFKHPSIDWLLQWIGNLPKMLCLADVGFWNHRRRCLKIDWLYCPSKTAGSDYLSPRQMTRTGPRRPDRVISSWSISKSHFDSNRAPVPPTFKLSGATGCLSASALEAAPIFNELPWYGSRLRHGAFGAR